MTLPEGRRFGVYEIRGPLGAGGMGEVYRAYDARLRRDVALKVLPAGLAMDEERRARFEREARSLAALNSQNIAAIYGIEESEGVYGLVLELVDGATLGEKLRDGALPIAETVAIAGQIADALDSAHEKGIVHRDLKPANIKITPDGLVKLLDFGLAKNVYAPAPEDASLPPTATNDATHAGVVLGTAAYMSPEQARGRPVDKRTDIWAFGCVLYEMLTGRSAFGRETVSDVIAAIIGSDPDWGVLPPATPPALRRLLPRLLDKDVKRRVRDIGDVRPDLEEARIGLASREPVSRPSVRRSWRGLALGLVAGLAAGVLAGSVYLGGREPPGGATIPNETIVSQLTNYDGTEGAGAISPDGRSFVFVSNQGGTPDIYVRQIAGGDPVRLTNDPAAESGLVYAPDGESIYFTRTEGSDRSIWRIGALGGQARKVLGDALAPAPSRDARRLAWFAPEANGTLSLWVGGTDGNDRKVIASGLLGVVDMGRAAWSPDGRRLAYSSGGLFAPRNLFVADVDNGTVRQVTHFDRSAEGPQTQEWLPDNRHLAVAYVPTPSALGSFDLGVLDVDTGLITRLTANISQSFSGPSVSSEGNRLIMTTTGQQREVWRVPFGPDPVENGNQATRMIDAALDPMWTFLTRDGRTLLFNNANVGSRNLWLLPLGARAGPRQITAVPGDAVMHSSLSPDGKQVAFASNTSGNSDIWVQNIDGSGLRQLTDDAAADAWPAWSPDGATIVFGSLLNGSWEIRTVPVAGGPAQKLVDGFFRGDWIRRSDGAGTWLVTSTYGGGLRLIDYERRSEIWQDRPPGNLGLPMFSADGRLVSLPVRESRDRDAIWVYDVATGKSRVAVRFPMPFQMYFRANWADDRTFVVNRYQTISRIVMFDGFWRP